MNLVFNEEFILSFIAISLFTFLVVSLMMVLIRTIFKVEELNTVIEALEEEAYPILQDLRNVIEYECNKTIKLKLTYITNRNALGIDHTKSLTKIISSSQVDELTIEVTNSIMEYLSDGYKERIYKVIKPEHLEQFIMEDVYQILFSTVLKINGNN